MKKKQQHPGGGADPWPHGTPLGGAPPGLGSWKRRVPLLPFLRFSLRDYGFCMATLLVFCLGSLFYQLSGGPPRFLLDLRQYLGKEGGPGEGGGGRANLCGGGGEGTGARRGLVALRPPAGAPRLPRWDVRVPAPSRASVRAAVRPSARRRRAGQVPRAGRRIPSPPLSRGPGRSAGVCVCGCVRVCVLWPGGVGSGEGKGQSPSPHPVALSVTVVLSREHSGGVWGVELAPLPARFCQFCPASPSPARRPP